MINHPITLDNDQKRLTITYLNWFLGTHEFLTLSAAAPGRVIHTCEYWAKDFSRSHGTLRLGAPCGVVTLALR
jgi:hypothetical protein